MLLLFLMILESCDWYVQRICIINLSSFGCRGIQLGQERYRKAGTGWKEKLKRLLQAASSFDVHITDLAAK